MKTEELKANGLTDEQIKYVMAEHGKELNDLKKQLSDVTAERDSAKKSFEDATETLKKFDGVDVEGFKDEIAKFKKQAEDAEKNLKDELYKRDFEAVLNTEMGKVKFTSESAKKSVMSEIQNAGLTMKDGKILGLTDLLTAYKEKDASAFVNEEQQNLENNKARFTEGMNMNNSGSAVTKESIMAIKDRSERRKAIAEHMDLFK